MENTHDNLQYHMNWNTELSTSLKQDYKFYLPFNERFQFQIFSSSECRSLSEDYIP